MKILVVLAWFCLAVSSFGQRVWASEYGDLNLVFHSNIKDVAEFNPNPNAKAVAHEILDLLQNNKTRAQLLGSHISYLIDGPHNVTAPTNGPESEHRIVKNNLQDIVYGVEIEKIKTTQQGDEISFRLLVHDSQHRSKFVFKFYTFLRGQISQTIQQTMEIPLSRFVFDLQVGIVQKKVIVTGQAQVDSNTITIKKVYPVDVGALDNDGVANNKYRSVTPLYQNHKLEARRAQYARTDPWYFRAMPFMGIGLTEELNKAIGRNYIPGAVKARTGVGFHRPMSFKVVERNNRKVRIASIKRGFDSHGCIRLQVSDLYELYAMLTKSTRNYMNLNIHQVLSDATDSNYPHYEQANGMYLRTAYHTIDLAKVKGNKAIGATFKLGGKNAVVTAIIGNQLQYKTLDKYGLDNFAHISTNKLLKDMSIGQESEIMASEQEALDWPWIN